MTTTPARESIPTTRTTTCRMSRTSTDPAKVKTKLPTRLRCWHRHAHALLRQGRSFGNIRRNLTAMIGKKDAVIIIRFLDTAPAPID